MFMNKRDSKTIKDQAGINLELKQFVDDVAQGKEIHQGTLELVARGIEKYLANPDKDPFQFRKKKENKSTLFIAQLLAVIEYYDISTKKLEDDYGFLCKKDLNNYTRRMKERLNDDDEVNFVKTVQFHKGVELLILKRNDPDKCDIENYLIMMRR